MGPHPSLLLVLVLCLGPAIHTQNRFLNKPSIRAEPGPVICRGRPVTIVCRGPAGADTFRLVQTDASVHRDLTGVVHVDTHWTEATFHIDSMNELAAGSYRCLYREGPSWSEPSETLELKVTDEDVFPPCSGTTLRFTPATTEVTLVPTGPGPQTAPASQDYTVGNCVRIGLSGVVLLILVGILAEAGHSWHRRPHQPQEGRQES